MDIQVVAMDRGRKAMIGEDGSLYQEVRPGLWAHFCFDGQLRSPCNRLYLQTSFHGDGVFLRVIYEMRDGA